MDKIIKSCFEAGIEDAYVKSVGHSKMDSIQMKILQKALSHAKEKAMLISQTLDIELGDLISVNETYHLIEKINRDIHLSINHTILILSLAP